MDSEGRKVGVGWEGKDPNCVSENPQMPVFASGSRMMKKKRSCWRKREALALALLRKCSAAQCEEAREGRFDSGLERSRTKTWGKTQ